MSQVNLDITMSLDGFLTAPDDGPGRGLGDDGERLHYWVFGGPVDVWRNSTGAAGRHRPPGARRGDGGRCGRRRATDVRRHRRLGRLVALRGPVHRGHAPGRTRVLDLPLATHIEFRVLK